MDHIPILPASEDSSADKEGKLAAKWNLKSVTAEYLSIRQLDTTCHQTRQTDKTNTHFQLERDPSVL